MARFSVADRSTAAGSATLPLFSIFATAAVAPKIREIGIFNTTTSACSFVLRRFTATGTVGAALTEMNYDNSSTVTATAFNTHTVTPTITAGNLRACTLGAAAGAAMIWTFGDSGLVIPAATTNGIGLLTVGTGQILDFYIDWDE